MIPAAPASVLLIAPLDLSLIAQFSQGVMAAAGARDGSGFEVPSVNMKRKLGQYSALILLLEFSFASSFVSSRLMDLSRVVVHGGFSNE